MKQYQVFVTCLVLVAILALLVPGTTFADDGEAAKLPWTASGNITQNLNKRATTYFSFVFDGKNLTGSGTIEQIGTTGPDKRPFHWKLTYTFITKDIDYTYSSSTYFTGDVVVGSLDNGVTEDHGKHTFQATKDHNKNILEVAIFGYDSISFKLPVKGGPGAPKWINREHTEPFYERKGKSDPRKAGDVVATILDENKIPIPGVLVFFCIKSGSPLDYVMINESYSISGDYYGNEIGEIWQQSQSIKNNRVVHYGYTGKDGSASFNYMLNIALNIEKFASKIKQGVIEGIINVVCFFPNPGNDIIEEYIFEGVESGIPVTFTGIAKIKSIHWVGDDDKEKKEKNKPNVKVVRAPGAFETATPKLVTKDDVPFYLLPGDKILLEQNDWVKVTWITGTIIRGGLKNNVSKGSLEIANEGTSWWIHAVKSSNNLVFGFILNASGLVLNIVSLAEASAIAGLGGIAVSLIGIYIVGVNAIEWKYSPFFMEIYSNILLDIDDEAGEMSIFLVEGKCLFGRIEDSTPTELNTGQKVTVSKEGNIGNISSFSLDTLDEDLTSLLEDEDEDLVSTSGDKSVNQVSTSEDKTETQVIEVPEGLTFESRNRPNGSEVQIPLTLNGIDEQVGNLDLTLTYDPNVLEAVDVIGGSLTLDSIMEHKITPGNIKIALADGKGFLGNGSIIYVKFNVIGSQGQTSPLNITQVNANGASYQVILLEGNNGLFNVTGVDESRGDFDGNGRLTAVDALSALQMAVGKRPVDLSLDMNNDGKVTSLDARTILKIAVGNN